MRHLCEIAQDRMAVNIRVQPKILFNPMINASDRLLPDVTYRKSANQSTDENLK